MLTTYWSLEKLHVKNFLEPQFHESMIENLVMDKSRIRILKALASSYIRVNQRGNHIEHDAWAADFVRGKGSGLIFLLHGKPGVGKTVTAGKPFLKLRRYHIKERRGKRHIQY